MKVLIACEFSGTVREAFTALEHNAWSCDILPTEIEGQHYQGDVREILDEGWDFVGAHPDCTYMTNSGVRWLYNKDKSLNTQRWILLEESMNFFNYVKGKIKKGYPYRYRQEDLEKVRDMETEWSKR